jgi:hypothetical protein
VPLGVVALAIGTVVGATLTTLGVRAAVALGASKSDLVIMVAGLVAVASVNALWWWYWGRDRAAKVRAADQLAAAWSAKGAEYRAYIATLEQENTRLNAEVERLTPAEVVSLLHQRMRETP